MMNYLGTEKTHVSVGPWGGQDGARWDDGIYNTAVKQVVICHGAAIDSIQIEYENFNGSSVWSDKHGGSGGIKTNKIKFDAPKEYLISISGHYGSIEEYYGEVHVRSLTFESNKKKYGPFGIQHGIQFSCPLNFGKIIGFHGRSSWHLDSIGVHLKPIPHRNPSNPNSIIPPPNIDTTGRKPKSEIIRRPVYGPANRDAPTIHYEKDQSGTVGRRVINNVKDMSNTMRPEKAVALGPWAEVPEPNNVGIIRPIIYGPANAYGVILHYEMDKRCTVGPAVNNNFKDISNEPPSKSTGKAVYYGPRVEVHEDKNVVSNARMVKEQITITSEAWGGIGGKPWDDGVFSGVKSVYLTKGEAIYCIQIEYDHNGRPVWSPRHGGGSERDSQTIKLDYPNEVLTGVSGSYESLDGDDTKYVIKSLTFYTNKGKHGPYGEQSGTFFSSNKSEGRIVGFHGRSGCYLNSIGVHIQNVPNIGQKAVEEWE